MKHQIEISPGYMYADEIKQLFLEYTQMLTQNDNHFAKYLELQQYDKELDHLDEKYGLPNGRLYLVKFDQEPAGCIALRKIDEATCEMKRLYVRPKYRGLGLADKLIQRLIADAKEIGYQAMLLDTLPFLEAAVHLYKKLGFYEVECYNNSPIENAIYMRLDLT